MELPKLFYNNVLNNAGVTFSISSASALGDRLYDYHKNKQWEADSGAAQLIYLDAGVPVKINALILDNHNLDGRVISLLASSDDFVASSEVIDSWSQAGNGNVLRQPNEAEYRYWKVSIASGAAAAKIGEMYLGAGIVFPKNPAVPHDPDQERDESEVKRSARGFRKVRSRFKRRVIEIVMRNMLDTPSSFGRFKTFWQSVRCFKPFYYCFRPNTSPQKVLLVRNTTKRFTAPLSGRIRTELKMIFEEVF